MNRLMKIIANFRGPRPTTGQVVMPRRADTARDYPSSGLTPARLAAILREADDGSLGSAMQLFEEMEEKDAHLFSVAQTRRLALTGLPWEIVPAPQHDQRPDATEAADYARNLLERIDDVETTLEHLSLATGRNIAIAEIVWERTSRGIEPTRLVPVDFTRIAFDTLDRPRILTADHPRDGIEPTPGKFIIHLPHGRSGHPQRGGLLRATALAYLAKNLALKDWMIFAEIFGMPVRIARYEPNATEQEKRELAHMLESLGSQAAGIFSRAVDLQIVEANRGNSGPPYPTLIEFLNREMSKAWLGQTLTTDTFGQRGSFAAGRVHELVRQDLLNDDARKEAHTLRRDLLGPAVALQFGPDTPVPLFQRITRSRLDRMQIARLAGIAVNDLGLDVPAEWLHETLQIPQSRDNQPVTPGRRNRPRNNPDPSEPETTQPKEMT